MIKHAMIDLETLGVTPDCAILSIGGVKFDPFTNEDTHSEISLLPDIDSQIERQRVVDPGTIEWWGSQTKEARETAFTRTGRISPEEMIKELQIWTRDCTKIWCQGPSFDFPILKNFFQMYGAQALPWKFWDERDSRTVIALTDTPRFKAVEHTAVDDCIQQVKRLRAAFKALDVQVVH